MRFIVVDDSNIARKRTIETLAKLGYEVVGEGADGLQGVEKAKELNPDFVAIDLEMPNMNGYDASREILKFNPKIKIMLITSIVDKKETLKALTAGISKVITKPFTSEQLDETIKDIMKKMQ